MESINLQTFQEPVLCNEKDIGFISPKIDCPFLSFIDSSNIVSKNEKENLQKSMQLKPSQEDHTLDDQRFTQEKAHSSINQDEMSDSSSEEDAPKLARSGRQQKFKRSTNNSHKKFISVARRWVFKNNPPEVKHAFESKFKAFKSTRTYFFIILAFIKSVMNEEKQKMFYAHFEKEVSAKIAQYHRQIQNTEMENLKHFRTDEITDLTFSIRAAQLYFSGDMDKSIQCVYKKDKTTIVKKHHYEEALKIVKAIQQELQVPNSVQDMIIKYGSKKPKTKKNSNQNSGKKLQKVQNGKSLEQNFNLSRLTDLDRALSISQNIFFNRTGLKGPRKTEAAEGQSSEDLYIEKRDLLQKQGKRINNIMVIPPTIQCNMNFGWESFLKKPSNAGFRPYHKQ